MLQSSNIPETDHDEYNAGTTYGDGDNVIVIADHKRYESLQANNINHTPSTSPTWWYDLGATNRWKTFDAKVQSQASQATPLNWVLNPGLIDSISLLNIDATEIQIIMADQNTDLVLNGTAWTGATGVTPPNSWDLVGSPSDFTIDGGALKITADAANEGISQTITVVPGTEMQLLGIYRNTAGDIAQYAVYDVTNAADILVTTDLGSSTVDSTLSYVFTVPAGCTSIRISLMAKANGDIVWFDTVSLSDVVYNKTVETLSTIPVIDWYTYFFEPIIRAIDIMKTDIAEIGAPPISTASVTIIVTYAAGTAKCGEIVMGLKFEIGAMRYNPSVGIIDYSIKATDDDGNMTITERAYSKRMSCDLMIKNTIIDEVLRQLTLYRAKPLVYVGSEDYSALIIYGFYKSFEIIIPYPNFSECSLELEGLT
jgi:hypothetical protein